MWGQGCSAKGVWYRDKAVGQREVWFEERTASWGAEGAAVGVQLLLSVALEGQVSPWSQIWEHQGCQSWGLTGGEMTRDRDNAVPASEMLGRVVQ